MVCDLALSFLRRYGSRGIGVLAAMVSLLVPLPRLVSQPEIVRNDQSNRGHGDTANH